MLDCDSRPAVAMSDEPLALTTIPSAPPANGDYDAICSTLMRTERGRWFLQEYARRNRNADTDALLVAIRRLEAVARGNQDDERRRSLRADLLDMARAVTRARAEVAEINPDHRPPNRANARPGDDAAPSCGPACGDVFAAAQRIRDLTWAIRGHGFDPSVCGQIEELARTILSASSLRNPADRRTGKLSDVLAYLERRINGLLGESAPANAGAEAVSAAPAHMNGNAWSGAHRADGDDPIALSGNEAEKAPSGPPAVATAQETPRAPAREAVAEPGPELELEPAKGTRQFPCLLLPAGDPPHADPIVIRPAPQQSRLATAGQIRDSSAMLLGLDTLATLRTFGAPAAAAPGPAAAIELVPAQTCVTPDRHLADGVEPGAAETPDAALMATVDAPTWPTIASRPTAPEPLPELAARANAIEVTPAEPIEAAPPPPAAVARPTRSDGPLAALEAMSDEERIAVFT